MRARAAIVVLLALAVLAPASQAAAAPRPETSLTEIESEVMCPVCGTLLELAESPQAQQEKVFVAKLIASGRSKGQVKDALVAQYGTAVLALPQGSGFDLSAYLVPIVALVIAVIALAFAVRKWRRDAGPPDRDGPAPTGPSPEDAKRLDADLARYDL